MFGSDLATLYFDFLCEDPVPCILCDETFAVHEDFQPILKHLLQCHKFVISSPEEIADFRHYILYWKKLQTLNLGDYCVIFATNTENGAVEPSEQFYLICDKLPEEKQIRKTLRKMKLNFLTQQKEEECQNKEFSRQCIYCPLVIEGGVANSFHHLTFDHRFSVGNPDNIVFGARLLDIMDDMLKRLKCLYCEKTFKNHIALRDHMRKKQHRSLNPKNKRYDKFYLINHIKPGVPWEEAKKSMLGEREISVPTETDAKDLDDSFNEDHLWTDWREESGDIAAVCLFCPFTTTKIDSGLFHHMENHHGFNFESATKGMNFYAKVKFVNFIRSQVKQLRCFNCDARFSTEDDFSVHVETCDYSLLSLGRAWDESLYLIPVLENDGLLIHLDDNDIEDEDSSSIASSVNEEVVLPEDAVPLPSILNDRRLREELNEDANGRTKIGSYEGGVSEMFKCFFCSFVASGSRGKNACFHHMNSMHNFNYKEAFRNVEGRSKNKAINYIRTMTDLGKCFVCEKPYITKAGLEEHRLLEEHLTLPPTCIYGSERWEKSFLLNDGLQDREMEHR